MSKPLRLFKPALIQGLRYTYIARMDNAAKSYRGGLCCAVVGIFRHLLVIVRVYSGGLREGESGAFAPDSSSVVSIITWNMPRNYTKSSSFCPGLARYCDRPCVCPYQFITKLYCCRQDCKYFTIFLQTKSFGISNNFQSNKK